MSGGGQPHFAEVILSRPMNDMIEEDAVHLGLRPIDRPLVPWRELRPLRQSYGTSTLGPPRCYVTNLTASSKPTSSSFSPLPERFSL